MPTHRRPRQLREAIDAILGQRYEGEIECLVVFDAEPPDDSLESEEERRRVRVLANDRTPGPAGARNAGILAAEGEYVAFSDDDDVWLPDRLARGIERLERDRRCDVATGPIRLRYGDHEVDRTHPRELIELADLTRDRIVSAHTTTFLVRRVAFEEIGGFDERAPHSYAEDYDWLLRAAARKPIAFLAGSPVAIIDRTGSMYSDWNGIDGGIRFLLSQHPELKSDRRGHARLLGRRALASAAGGRRRQTLSLARRALGLHPLEPRALVSIPVAFRLLSIDRLTSLAEGRGRTL